MECTAMPLMSGTTSVCPRSESPSFRDSAGLSLIEAWPASEKCARTNRNAHRVSHTTHSFSTTQNFARESCHAMIQKGILRQNCVARLVATRDTTKCPEEN